MRSIAPEVKYSIVQPGFDFGHATIQNGVSGGREYEVSLWSDVSEPSDEDKARVTLEALQYMIEHAHVADGRIDRPEVRVIKTERYPRIINMLGHTVRLGTRKEVTILDTIPLNPHIH